jgi:hypothetical protein
VLNEIGSCQRVPHRAPERTHSHRHVAPMSPQRPPPPPHPHVGRASQDQRARLAARRPSSLPWSSCPAVWNAQARPSPVVCRTARRSRSARAASGRVPHLFLGCFATKRAEHPALLARTYNPPRVHRSSTATITGADAELPSRSLLAPAYHLEPLP